jgi:hypothetical protein
MPLNRLHRTVAWLIGFAPTLLPGVGVQAQGVAGAALQGTVERASGAPLPDVRIALTDSRTGNRRYATSSAHGSFAFETVPVGGPYTLEVTAIGFVPTVMSGITLHLGDRLMRRVVLDELAQRLVGVTVAGDAFRDAGSGGPVHDVPGEAARALPLPRRDFVGLLAMASQASGSANLSIGGQHNRLNAIQVDGGSASDFLGLDVTPGANVGARALSLESLQELRILIAPFDVRQGGFSGGLINAVTRSGTNQFRGSAFVSTGRNDLVGADTAGTPVDPFTMVQYGVSAGGPIVRDRLHYFVVADIQSQQTPATGLAVNDRSVGVADSAALRIAQIIRDRYHFDPGGTQVPVLQQPNSTVFTKLSWQPASAHLVELTNNFSDARSDALARGITGLKRDGWQLSLSGSSSHVRNNTTRVKATSIFGVISNELIASVAIANLETQSTTRAPTFLVSGATSALLPIAAGSTKGAQNTITDQRLVEFTDNVTWSRDDHLVTAGVQTQLAHIHDSFFLGAWGTWTFADADALAQGTATKYEINIAPPNRPEGPLADYSPFQLAAYAQDRWQATPHLTLTGGLRIDAPFLGNPTSNAALLADAALGHIDTGRLPAGNAVISPRLGFAYGMGRDGTWLLRGGAGSFSGHPPYAWVSGAYSTTGQDQATLTCVAANGIPAPTADVDHLPVRCLNSGGLSTAKAPVTIFAPDFHFQQAVKIDIGIEHDIGNGLTASMDMIHTRTRDAAFLRDVNLVDLGADAEGRIMYGRITNRGSAFDVTTSRLDSAFGPVYRFENRSGERSTSLTLELQKSWSSGLLQVGYTWSRTDDMMSMSGLQGPNIMASNPIDGSMTDRTLRRSARDIPHNVVVTAVMPVAFGVTASALLRARSGTPYSYTVNKDPNGDGFVNDLAYIPRDSLDVSLAQPATYRVLDAFIRSDACLRESRGQIMARNSCRNPAVATLDVRLARRLQLTSVRGTEVGVDIFNLPNLLNGDWGLVRESSSAEGLSLLEVAGWDAVANRPRYAVLDPLPGRSHVLADVSRWRVQLSARVDF